MADIERGPVARKRLEAAEAEVERLRSRLAEVEAECAELRATHDAAQMAINLRQREMEHAVARAQRAEEEVERLREALDEDALLQQATEAVESILVFRYRAAESEATTEQARILANAALVALDPLRAALNAQ